MGLQQVKSEILEDAEQKAEEIVSEAEEEADEITSEAEEEAEKIRQEYEEQLEKEKEAYERKTVSNAEMKSKQEKLKAKEEKLQEVFEELAEELNNLSDKEKQDYVERCLEKVEFEPGKVIGNSEYEEYVDVEFEESDIDGIIVVSEDGEKRQDFSFDKIIQRFEDDYRKDAAEKLFEAQ